MTGWDDVWISKMDRAVVLSLRDTRPKSNGFCRWNKSSFKLVGYRGPGNTEDQWWVPHECCVRWQWVPTIWWTSEYKRRAWGYFILTLYGIMTSCRGFDIPGTRLMPMFQHATFPFNLSGVRYMFYVSYFLDPTLLETIADIETWYVLWYVYGVGFMAKWWASGRLRIGSACRLPRNEGFWGPAGWPMGRSFNYPTVGPGHKPTKKMLTHQNADFLGLSVEFTTLS